MYNPYFNNPYMQTPAPMAPNATNQQQVVKVNGRNGAEAFQMAPNSSTLLLDETAPIVWLATTDGAGYKTLAAYDIAPHQEQPPIDLKALEERIATIERKLSHGDESNNTSNKRKVLDEQ